MSLLPQTIDFPLLSLKVGQKWWIEVKLSKTANKMA